MESRSGGAVDIVVVGTNAISVVISVGRHLSSRVSALTNLQMSPMIETDKAGDDKEPQIRETGESYNADEAPMKETEERGNAARVGKGFSRNHPSRGKGRPKKRGLYYKRGEARHSAGSEKVGENTRCRSRRKSNSQGQSPLWNLEAAVP